MNIAIINIKDIIKYLSKIAIVVTIFFFANKMLRQEKILNNVNIKTSKITENPFTNCIDRTILLLSYNNSKQKQSIPNISLISGILGLELGLVNNIVETSELEINKEELTIEDTEELVDNSVTEVIEKVQTEVVNENNIPSTYTNSYNSVEIKNKTEFELTEEMLMPNIEISNKNDIIIYHTHTCESYTTSEQYNYEMTGNYRTTDLNYTVVKVGNELKNELESKEFNIVHNNTYHDYPTYSGSYTRSLETIQNLLTNSSAEIVFDIHRDAVGSSNEYGPTVKINNEYAAQLMFVIGTNGSGLEHANWNQNLKLAIKIQAKANEIYPGLFRPILLTTSRYNQHVTKGASIIEVGATGNTMEQCLLSMRCLANVIKEALKE